jgi:hypothetical protein
MAVEDLNASNDNCILGFLIAGEKHSSNFDISPKQSFELVRRIEQAARQADAVIELTKELRQQLRQDLNRTACLDGVIELTKRLREQLRQDIDEGQPGQPG